MKSEQVIKERLNSAKQEHDIIDMLINNCEESEREGLLRKRAKLEAEVGGHVAKEQKTSIRFQNLRHNWISGEENDRVLGVNLP